MSVIDSFIESCSNVNKLADGGQKSVSSAEHSQYGAVVIKLGQYGKIGSLERINREVELLRELDSDFYPKHYEFLVDPMHSRFLIVEERLAAKELTHYREQFDTDQKILDLLIQLVIALNILWARKVVHRDLKPANILITAENLPRIIDLGIARFLDSSSLTATIAAMGPATPIYAAPEQLLNKKSMISPRTDFFNLGIIVAELMLGFHPFDPTKVGNNKSIVENILSGAFVRPGSDHDELLVGFVNTVLNTQPYLRFRTPENVMQYLGVIN